MAMGIPYRAESLWSWYMIECLLSTVHQAGNLMCSGFLGLDAQQKRIFPTVTFAKLFAAASMAASVDNR